MHRRQFHLGLLAGAGAGWPLLAPASPRKHDDRAAGSRSPQVWSRIEAAVGGRLGVAVLDTGTGRLEGRRLDERFPMCSTFKWLLAAQVLSRVEQGRERLDRRIRFDRDVLLPNSPVTETRSGGEGMTVAELCEATVTVSDNAAANLLLAASGGPVAWTGYARSLGDAETRLDRPETDLNTAQPDDPRDTTTPRAMSRLLQKVVLGDALSPAGRAQLVRWMEGSRTNGRRLGAALPAGWRLGSKTGTGARGTCNDVGVYWPPAGRAPIAVVACLTGAGSTEAARQAAIANVGRLAVA